MNNNGSCNEESLKSLVERGFTQGQIARELQCSRSNVRYWLRKLKLTTTSDYMCSVQSNPMCQICGKDTTHQKFKTMCMSCRTKVRRHRAKLAAIEYLGGKCKHCGTAHHPSAMEFHHRDPQNKEVTIGMVANKQWAVIKKELDKCDLLCSNCHRVFHSERYDGDFIEKVLKYDPDVLDFRRYYDLPG